MNKSLAFFAKLYETTGPVDDVTGLPVRDVQYQTSTVEYDPNDPNKTTDVINQTHEIKSVPHSLSDPDKFINYAGNSKINSYDPFKVNDQNLSSISAHDLIQWSKTQNSAHQFHFKDFAYLKDVSIYPVNRLMVLRRFPEAIGHNLFSSGQYAKNLMAGYYSLEDPPVKVTLSEKWTTFDGTFLDVIQDVIGINFGSIPLVGQVFSKSANSPLAQDMMYRIGTKMGILSEGMPYGNPDLIHEAAVRDVSGESLHTGLKSDVTVEFETTYVFREWGKLSGRVAMLDLLANATNMASSQAKFLIDSNAQQSFKAEWTKIMTQMANGDVSGFVTTIIDGMKEILTDSLQIIKESSDAIVDAGTKGNIEGVFEVVVNQLKNFASDLIKQRYSRYRWKLVGAASAMTGAPSAYWHITLGNPMFPWFSCGNMVLEDCEIIPGGEMSYDDMFTELTVKIKLKSGRAMGADEIQSLFNVGTGRITEEIPKNLKTNKIPKGSRVNHPGEVINSNEKTKGTDTNSIKDSDPAMDLPGTSNFGINNVA